MREQLAVQGPDSEKVVEEVLGLKCAELTFYTVKTICLKGTGCNDKASVPLCFVIVRLMYPLSLLTSA